MNHAETCLKTRKAGNGTGRRTDQRIAMGTPATSALDAVITPKDQTIPHLSAARYPEAVLDPIHSLF